MRALTSIGAAALALFLAAPAWAGTGDAAAIKIAVFKFELLDTSGGPPQGEEARIELITDLLRLRLAGSERYDVVDVAGVSALANKRQADLAAGGYFSQCNGCEAPIAAALGADRSLSGTVQKVSNLILNINVYIRDANTGEMLEAYSVDIRGNTDQSWTKGISWLVRNRLLR